MAGLHCSLLPIHQSRLPEMRFPVTAMPGPILSTQDEQSCTERGALTCHRQPWRRCQIRKNFLNSASLASEPNRPYLGRKNECGSLMQRAFHQFRDRFRRRLAAITASVSKLFAFIAPTAPGFASQRMCPFCGLITSRSKNSCLECGKSLAPAR
jgi:hypothetical protein